jgi:hypothetical protein
MNGQSRPQVHYVNNVEPQALISNFHQHPPVGFNVGISEQGLPYFSTHFDLLTTVDNDARVKFLHWPGSRLWRRLLNIDTNFIGTTVNEYSVFPQKINPIDITYWIIENCTGEKKITIIKDIPQHSPLLSVEDNQYSQALVDECTKRGFILVEGEALAYVPIDFNSIDDYLSRLSHSRRRNIRRKLRSQQSLRLEMLTTGDMRFQDETWRRQLYQLYKAVYDQSEIHFDLLSAEFFTDLLLDSDSGGRVFCYWLGEELVGYNLCYQQGDKLIDKYIGLNYPLALQYNLYVISWFANLEYARNNGLRFYVAGWTDPQVKSDLGAKFTFTVHLAWIRNPLLRMILNRFRHYFESDARWRQDQQL